MIKCHKLNLLNEGVKMFKNISIEKGVHSWEVLQQENGYADICIGGRYVVPGSISEKDRKNAVPCIRIVDEINDMTVCRWKEAKVDGEGGWSCTFERVPCGGPYRVESRLLICREAPFEGSGSVIGASVHHIGVGDNFLIAGQSNAAGIGRGAVTDEPDINVHVFRDDEYWDIATNPLHSGNTLHGFSLPFAKLLKRKLNYPIGLIPSAVGGSAIKRWVKGSDGDLYADSVDILKINGIKIKAVLWLQGESDTKPPIADIYYSQFKKVVENYRTDLNMPDLPFITAQINRCIADNSENPCGIYWDKIREIQRKASHEMKNVYVIPTLDSLKLSDWIHNSSAMNIVIGERLAMRALDVLYGKINFKIPEIEYAKKISENTAEFKFINVQSFLINQHFGNISYPIAVTDEEGEIPIDKFDIQNDTVTIKFKRRIMKNAKAKCQYGINPPAMLLDLGSQMPPLAFSDYSVE